jgi:D-glycero-alpha-D-manno-heptose-7-phosphate kinase
MNALIARAPTRLDFGGGWTDVPPYSEEEGGFVFNIAIARYATVRVCAAHSSEASIDTRRATDTALAEAAVRRAGIEGITVGRKLKVRPAGFRGRDRRCTCDGATPWGDL